MKSIKRRIETFQFYDPKGIEKHLQKMAAKGWMLDDITSVFWVYKRIEPTTLHFNVAYFNSASDYDPSPSTEQCTFYDYCRDAGWQFVASQQVMQIFYSTKEDPTPIETEPRSSLQTIHQGFKKSVLYANLALILYGIFQLHLLYRYITSDLAVSLASYGTILSTCICLLLSILALLKIVGYGYWYFTAKKSIERENYYDEQPPLFSVFRRLDQALLVMILLVVLLFSFTSTWGVFIPISIGTIYIIYSIVIRIRGTLKNSSVSKHSNQVATGVITVLLSFVAIPLLIMTLTSIIGTTSEHNTYSYTTSSGNHVTYDIYDDTLPLEISDIYTSSYSMFSKEYNRIHSLLSTYIQGSQESIPFDSAGPRLHYEVSILHIPSLITPVLDASVYEYETYMSPEELLESGLSFVPIDPSPWKADDAYQSKDVNGFNNNYILRWGNRIAKIRTNFPLDSSMMDTIQKKLRDIS